MARSAMTAATTRTDSASASVMRTGASVGWAMSFPNADAYAGFATAAR